MNDCEECAEKERSIEAREEQLEARDDLIRSGQEVHNELRKRIAELEKENLTLDSMLNDMTRNIEEEQGNLREANYRLTLVADAVNNMAKLAPPIEECGQCGQ